MCIEYNAKAYAKVNFNLKVLPKRADGFHSIESIFQTIDLYDEIQVSVDDDSDKNRCSVICDSMNLPVKNTLTSAYYAFSQVTNCDLPAITVKLIKGIPSGGGLGGGSSDAAALVRVLQKISGISLTVEQLDLVAAKTGSDVFFFMHCDQDGRGCALVSGRGEIIKKINPRNDLFLLLIFPEINSSTKEAYELVDQYYTSEQRYDGKNKVKFPDLNDLESVYRLNPTDWTFMNTFTPVLCLKYISIRKAIEALKNGGADYCEMSGSGSTVFGVFTLEQQAIHISNLLAESFNCRLVKLI